MVARKEQRKKRVIPEDRRESIDENAPVPARYKSLVFVSHDSRDADLAEAFADLLADVSGGTLKSFRSSDKKGATGIEFGAEWYTSIMSQLGDATDVVALLTARSIDRPWILYEAGVAKGKLETTVLGLALGVPLERVSTGPFGQFQNCGDDEDSLTKLVMQLLKRNPEAAPREEAVRRQVRSFMEASSGLLAARPKKEPSTKEEDQGVAKLFEEVKAMVRELPSRVDERVRVASKKRRGGPTIHPGIIDEIFSTLPRQMGEHGSAAALLFVCAALKDDVPWFYEPAMQLYRAMVRGNPKEISAARRQLKVVLDVANHSPWIHEMIASGGEESFYVSRHLSKFLDRYLRVGTVRSSNQEASDELS